MRERHHVGPKGPESLARRCLDNFGPLKCKLKGSCICYGHTAMKVNCKHAKLVAVWALSVAVEVVLAASVVVREAVLIAPSAAAHGSSLASDCDECGGGGGGGQSCTNVITVLIDADA